MFEEYQVPSSPSVEPPPLVDSHQSLLIGLCRLETAAWNEIEKDWGVAEDRNREEDDLDPVLWTIRLWKDAHETQEAMEHALRKYPPVLGFYLENSSEPYGFARLMLEAARLCGKDRPLDGLEMLRRAQAYLSSSAWLPEEPSDSQLRHDLLAVASAYRVGCLLMRFQESDLPSSEEEPRGRRPSLTSLASAVKPMDLARGALRPEMAPEIQATVLRMHSALLLSQDRPSDAKPMMDKAVSTVPRGQIPGRRSEMLIVAARVFQRCGDNIRAAELLREALKDLPEGRTLITHLEVYLELVWFALELSDLQTAKAWLSECHLLRDFADRWLGDQLSRLEKALAQAERKPTREIPVYRNAIRLTGLLPRPGEEPVTLELVNRLRDALDEHDADLDNEGESE